METSVVNGWRSRVFAAVLMLLPAIAHGSWNDEWAARKRLEIDTSAAGANITEPIGQVAVLVRLVPGNFRFDAAKEDGSDLRFIAGDDKTPLPYHIEKYDALLGEALVWVGIPDLKPGAKTDIWLYFKNPKAVSAEDAKGTYDPATLLVYHFAEKGQPPRDSSSWANHALNAGTSADGALIGHGLRLDGTTVSVPASASLLWKAGAPMTWSAWIKPSEAESTGIIYSRREGDNAFLVGVEAGKPFVAVTDGTNKHRAEASTALAANGWHHVAVTAGDQIALYVDGALAATVAAPLPALNTPALIGGDSPATAPPAAGGGASAAPAAAAAPALAAFKGELDELEISKVERPAGFIKASAISQGTDPGKFLVPGQDEESSSWSSGYLAVILRSVTLDGWVVIGLLAVMGIVSITVMVNKAAYLSSVEKANEYFLEKFRQRSGELARLMTPSDGGAQLGEPKKLKNSPLYRIFRISATEVSKRTDGATPLRGEAMAAIRASLDAGIVRESQRLTSRMVLLTIAISGGPFLGLLGTVVGVMITFAAIAAAGDVNVNAIAPGIAAALVATVAGLAVAIPALFGYNWLLTRIKDITANMQVFVDELVTQIAETYSGHSASESPAKRHAIAAAE